MGMYNYNPEIFVADKKNRPEAEKNVAAARKPTITVSDELHERCKAWAALHGLELGPFVEKWIEDSTADIKEVHDRIRAGRKASGKT